MSKKQFSVIANISTDGPEKIKAALDELFVKGSIEKVPGGFAIRADMTGKSARDLNRELLSSLRKIEKKTRLRAEWTSGKITEKFFDYVPKGKRKA
jgi:hypothetical protein